ncbi:MAG: DUF4368 domain-containing protein [Ruminococcus sp.]|nr:DUF4368 domain-containing protein [Ruminococcus sp.]
MQFVEIVKKYEKITELTPEILHEFIKKIVVHAPEGGRANRTQQIDIYFRFNVATSTAIQNKDALFFSIAVSSDNTIILYTFIIFS